MFANVSRSGRTWTILARLVRSAGGGALATVADVGTLAALVSLVGAAPRVASVPALLAGNVVMFFAQKHVAFRARGGDVRREAIRFALVQAGGFALNAWLYDFAVRTFPAFNYIVARFVTTNLVWLAYSFPAWHFVFVRANAKPGEEARQNAVSKRSPASRGPA